MLKVKIKPIIHLLIIPALLSSGFLFLGCGNKTADGKKTEDTAKSDTTQSDTTATDSSDKEKDKNKGLDAIPVEVVTAKRGDISAHLIMSSTLETEQYVDVFPYLNGIVVNLFAEEGDNLIKGEPLLKLEDEEHKLNEKNASLAMQKAENEFKRVENLYKKELASKELYDDARFAYEQAKISWQQAALTLERTVVKAPISGVVSLRNVRQGDRVNPSTHLYSMVNLDDMVATVYIPEKEIPSIWLGQKTLVTSDFMEGKVFQGTVKRISPIVDPASGTFKVTIGITGAHKQLRPGMFVNANIVTQTNRGVILLPKDVLVYDADKMFVFVVKDSVAEKIMVKTGFSNASRIEIVEGVSESDSVIIVGQSGLRDQTKVSVQRIRETS